MAIDRDEAKAQIRAKVVELAASRGADADGLADDDIIPATGLLDSMAILELLVWYENAYGLSMRPDEINVDNLGSIAAMADFLMTRQSGR
jgi:acyl carrier protein